MFLYRLAAALGIVDVEAMASAMTPDQIDGWAAYDAAEPLGGRGLMRQLSEFMAMFSASHGGDTAIDKFYPGVTIPNEREQTPEEQRAAVRKAERGVG